MKIQREMKMDAIFHVPVCMQTINAVFSKMFKLQTTNALKKCIRIPIGEFTMITKIQNVFH